MTRPSLIINIQVYLNSILLLTNLLKRIKILQFDRKSLKLVANVIDFYARMLLSAQ